MNNAKQLEYLRQQTKSYKSLIEDLKSRSSQEYDIRDFGYIVAAGSKLCESLLGYIVQQKGYKVDYERGMVEKDVSAGRHKNLGTSEESLYDFCISEKVILPEECRSFIRLIKQYRNKAVYAENETSYELIKTFSKAMERFIFWFENQTDGAAQLSSIALPDIAIGGALPLSVTVAAATAAGSAAIGAGATAAGSAATGAGATAAGLAVTGVGAAVAGATAVALTSGGILRLAKSIFNMADGDENYKCSDKRITQKATKKQVSHAQTAKSRTGSLTYNCAEEETSPQITINTVTEFEGGKQNARTNQERRAAEPAVTENRITPTTVAKLLTDSEAIKKDVQKLAEKMEQVLRSSVRIENKVDKIEQMIKMLSGKVNAFQKFAERQLSRAESEDEAERIISSYTDECADCIVTNTVDTCNQDDNKVLKEEQEKLIKLIGSSGWDKLDETSQRFLVSARVLFRQFQKLQDIIDYSGVCVLVTKALEVEMDKRFYKNFLSFLNEKYKEDYTKYHTALLYKNKTILKPLKPQSFTMGNIAFVLCFIENRNDSDLQKENNRIQLLDYAKSKLLSKYSEEEIEELLREYAKAIEKIRKNFRNPSAHTNEIKRMDAENCLNLVLDVQKLLKRMLDSFDF